MNRLKNNKASVVRGINSELLKYAGPACSFFCRLSFLLCGKQRSFWNTGERGTIIFLWKRKAGELTVPIIGNNASLSTWQTLLNGASGPLPKHYLPNRTTRTRRFYVRAIDHRANIHSLSSSREKQKILTESIHCLCRLPCCLRFNRPGCPIEHLEVYRLATKVMQTLRSTPSRNR